MKSIYILSFLIILKSNINYCQLLTNPSLTIRDFEIALSNPDNMRGILLEHNFKYERFENENYSRSECWQSKLETVEISKLGLLTFSPMIDICIYEYKPNHRSLSGVIASIDIQIYKDPIISDKLVMFIDSIRSHYPERSTRTRDGSNPFLVHSKKGSKIEVEVSNSQTEFSKYDCYFLTFNLYESPYF